MKRSVNANLAPTRWDERRSRDLLLASLTALLLGGIALPAAALVTEGGTLSVAPGAAPEFTTRAPVQGERLEAPADRTVAHVLPDGTALTLSPGSSLTIARYEYDPTTRSGELALELGPGLFRVTGGAINNASPIALSTGSAPACQMTLANGAAVIAADPSNAVRTYLLYGERLTVTSGDATADLVRPGFELASACYGDAPDEAPLSEVQLRSDMFQLNPGLATLIAPGAGEDEDDVAGAILDETTEDQQPDPTGTTPPGPGPATGRTIAGALGTGKDYGPGEVVVAGNRSEIQSTGSDDGLPAFIQGGFPNDDSLRNPGLTTNITFSSTNFTQSLEEDLNIPFPAEDVDQHFEGDFPGVPVTTGEGLVLLDRTSNVQYRFNRVFPPDELEIIRVGENTLGGPLRIDFDEVPNPGEIRTVEDIDALSIVIDSDPPLSIARNPSAFLGPAQYNIFQQGFSLSSSSRDDVRDRDNFLLVESKSLTVRRILRDELIATFNAGGGGVNDVMTTRGLDRFWAAIIPHQAFEGRSLLEDNPGVALKNGLGEDNARAVAIQILNPLVLSSEIDPVSIAPIRLEDTELRDFGLSDELVDRLLAIVNLPIEGASGSAAGVAYMFAAGDVDGQIDPDGAGPLEAQRDLAPTIDQFFISPGLDGFEQRNGLDGPTVASPIRAFLRRETAFSDPDTPNDESFPLNDTGVLIVNASPNAMSGELVPHLQDRQTALLHADFGSEGKEENQRSTISITIGEVLYSQSNRQNNRDNPAPADDRGNEVLVTAHTFGSSRDNTNRDPESDRTQASTFMSSPLFNTAAGGGNPDLHTGVDADGDGKPDPRQGRVGYIVFENFSPKIFEQVGGTPAANRTAGGLHTGGLEDPVDPLGVPEPERQYAILRLGTAVGSLEQNPEADWPSPNVVNVRSSRALEGFAAGIAEFQGERNIGVVPVDAGIPIPSLKPLLPNLLVETSRDTNQVQATMSIVGLDVSSAQPVVLGGIASPVANGLSAYVDDDTFAARTPAGSKGKGEYAMVTALSLTRPTADPAVRELPGLGDVPVLRHTQWGFFLGERLAKLDGRDVREHVHLGAWAAGEKLRDDALGGWSGTATYEGVAVGNVFRAQANDSGGSLSTVVGNYRNQWDFGARTGNVDMSFDQRNYTGQTKLGDGGRFVGSLNASDRTGRLDGAFVGKVNDFTGADGRSGRGPTGLAGQFAITEKNPSNGIYRATGVVAADRKEK